MISVSCTYFRHDLEFHQRNSVYRHPYLDTILKRFTSWDYLSFYVYRHVTTSSPPKCVYGHENLE